MSDGGSIVNLITVKDVITGQTIPVRVITSHNSVEIANWSFDREELLFALGAKA